MQSNCNRAFLVLDAEGTLLIPDRNAANVHASTNTSVWHRIAMALGPQAVSANEARRAKWKNGNYRNYLYWAEETLEDFSIRGLTRTIFEEVLATYSVRQGVDELFSFIKRMRIEPVLVSGGFHELADIVLPRYEVHHSNCTARLIWDHDGKLNGWSINPADYADKARYLQRLCDAYNHEPIDCAFIGDGANDVDIAQIVGCSIALGDEPFLKQTAKHHITEITEAVGILERWCQCS